MKFLFQLPTWLGIVIVVVFVVVAGLLAITQTRKRIQQHFTKQHEKVGRLLFRTSAGVIALLISLSYANGRIEQNKLRDTMELEASLIVNVFAKLQIYGTEDAFEIREKIRDYVQYTIEDNWEDVKANPFYSEGTGILISALQAVYHLPTATETQEILKKDILIEMNQISKLMQVRIYSQGTYTPFLIHILFFGLFIVWMFFTVYKQNVISLAFISLYNIFIAILIYFIFIMSNPLVGDLKMDAHSFSIIKTKGIDQKLK